VVRAIVGLGAGGGGGFLFGYAGGMLAMDTAEIEKGLAVILAVVIAPLGAIAGAIVGGIGDMFAFFRDRLPPPLSFELTQADPEEPDVF